MTGADAFAALRVGKQVTVRKTVSESDVYLFVGLTGDLSPNHVDEEYMRKTKYGRRIAHGALLVGLMSQASTRIITDLPGTIVSYGYDRVRTRVGSSASCSNVGAASWFVVPVSSLRRVELLLGVSF